MINGIINVYKEKGFTSHDVVAKLRGILKQKKIGHTGTLDPEAEGVLPVCLGKAARVCDMLTEKDKVYEAELLLGTVTDTQDSTGTVLAECPVTCSREEAEKAIVSFIGEYQQIPPMYSALKVNGKKLCDLARAGIEVERKPRTVTIYSIRILEMSLPRARMEVHCSKGTYIRTLCHDIGESLGCGGCMKSLIRTRAAGFELKDAWKLGEIEELVHSSADRIQRELTAEDLPDLIKSTDFVFRQYPKVSVKPEFCRLLLNGNPLRPEWISPWKQEYRETLLRAYDEQGIFTGIYQWDERRKDIRPVKILR